MTATFEIVVAGSAAPAFHATLTQAAVQAKTPIAAAPALARRRRKQSSGQAAPRAANRLSTRTGIGGSFQSEGGASGTSMTAGWVPHVRVAGRLLGAGFRGPSKRFTGGLRRDFRMPVAMQQQTAVRAALPPVRYG